MRRWLVPVLLALVGVSSAVLAVRPPAGGGEDAPAPGAAVLSPRRVPVLLSQVVADTRLRTALDSALAAPALGAGRDRSCLVVRQGGRELFERRPEVLLIPASNLKVLTGIGVLTRLGAGETFVTEVRAASVAPGGVVDGPLWLVGGGDPLLATADYVASFRNQPQVHTPLEALADAVVAAGVKAVPAGVIGDETRYDAQRYVPTWKPGYVTAAEVGPASALIVNDGFAALTPRRVAAPEPDVHAAGVLTALLQARGVTVGGPPGEGQAPAGATVVARVASPPLAEVVAQMLRESDNTTAELLVKELGHRAAGSGTTAAGLAALGETLAGLGLPVEHLSVADGSGLDRSNRATCGLLMAALDHAGRDGTVAGGFPVAARDGTLSRRFLGGHPAGGRLRAKTGALEGVSGLTGWLDVPGGAPLAFSLLVNDLPRNGAGPRLQEEVAAVLARYPDAPRPAELAP